MTASVRERLVISRRELLKAAFAVTSLSLLAGCGATTPASPSPAEVAQTSAPVSVKPAAFSAATSASSVPAAPAAIAAASPSSSAASPGSSAARPSGQLEKATLVEGGHTIPWASAYVAQAKGYFQQNGVDVDYQTSAHGTTEAIAAVVSGSALLAFTGSVSQIAAIQSGAPLRIVATLGTQYGAEVTASNKLLAAKKVTPQSPLQQRVESLRGAKVGIYTPGDSTDALARVLFKKFNVNPDTDLQMVSLGTAANMLSAFEKGSLDAMIVSPPGGEQAEDAHIGTVFIRPDDLPEIKGYPYLTAVASLNGIQSKSKLAVGVLKAMASGEKLLRTDPDGAKVIVRDFFKDFDQKVFDLTYQAMLPSVPANPIPTESDFNALVNFSKLQGKPLTMSYDALIDSKLAQQAVKELGS